MKAGVKPQKSEKTYSEGDLLKAIKYACEYQKGKDYQTAGNLLIIDANLLPSNSILLLDELASNTDAFTEIELKDIFK